MNKIITLSTLGFLLAYTGAMGQCTSSIPANATVVTNASQSIITANSQNFWACGDAFQKIFSGNNNHIWIESGAWVSVTGGGNTVYYRGDVPIGIFGNGNIVYVQTTAAIADQGTGTVVHACGTGLLVFNYGAAPAGGCAGVGIEENAITDIEMYPNPVIDVLTLEGNTPIRSVEIMGVDGRSMITRSGATARKIDMSSLASGTYLIRIITDNGYVMRRLQKH